MMNKCVLKIGPIAFEIAGPAGARLHYRDPAYQGFWKGEVDEGVALARLPVTVVHQAVKIPRHEPLYEGGRNWAIWQEDGDLMTICSGFYQRDAAAYTCRVDRALQRAGVYVDPSREGCEAPLCYPLDQVLSWGLLGRSRGFILHAAVAVKDGVGWVFTGKSGAGKSTISGLLHADGWRILNDDRVMIYPRGHVLKVAGTPWHGSGRFAEAAEVDLGGICFIHQAGFDQLCLMSADEARMALLDVAAVPWFEDAWFSLTLQALEQVCAMANFRHFHFTRSQGAVDAMNRFVQQNEVAA